MAWEISMSPEGWQEVYETLHEAVDVDFLAEAIATDAMHAKVEALGEDEDVDWEAMEAFQKSEEQALKNLGHESLADMAYGLIEQNNTCENGGFEFWIDRKGDSKVNPDVLFEHRFGQAMRLLDMDVTGNDPATIEAFYRRNGLMKVSDWAYENVAVTLSDEKTKIGFHLRTGQVLNMKGASVEQKEVLERAEKARVDLCFAVHEYLIRKDPEIRYEPVKTANQTYSMDY